MPAGKMAAQAIHAARLSLLKYIQTYPYMANEFIELNSCGTAVNLLARNLPDLLRAQDEAQKAGLPCALFWDSGHILPPYFDGSKIATALAIGPARREHMRKITKRFRCI